jgi:hypothetical protein
VQIVWAGKVIWVRWLLVRVVQIFWVVQMLWAGNVIPVGWWLVRVVQIVRAVQMAGAVPVVQVLWWVVWETQLLCWVVWEGGSMQGLQIQIDTDMQCCCHRTVALQEL